MFRCPRGPVVSLASSARQTGRSKAPAFSKARANKALKGSLIRVAGIWRRPQSHLPLLRASSSARIERPFRKRVVKSSTFLWAATGAESSKGLLSVAWRPHSIIPTGRRDAARGAGGSRRATCEALRSASWNPDESCNAWTKALSRCDLPPRCCALHFSADGLGGHWHSAGMSI